MFYYIRILTLLILQIGALSVVADTNLTTCLSGKYPALCKHNLLNADEAKRVQNAELNESAHKSNINSRSLSRAKRGSMGRGGCEAGHWIESVSDNGSIIKLEDGSLWEVDSVDAIDTMLWLPTTDIVSCDDKLINTEDNETVDAIRLK